ncbi:hypothetical protein BOTBODRAFT_35542 [Botryobasidium botryosum FD-172 SS1]|uniref:HTH La-type RNA-binding domain-containing protein n=1 Tax=Botryobasidium botryosum (strain FD-172 SS1) TaxID=930990 RepID=A0A067MI49_BOTB1|nr:hypothetical protein BOTBODRAFT_35542 [Botryobasidium botryosum FD-172 SS1]
MADTAAQPLAADASDAELQKKALHQIEFYFRDSNLPFDRFMWALHTKHPENWVPISTVASFKRMRPFHTRGLPWIVDALRKSEGLLEVDEAGENVRRKTEVLPPKGQLERSVYAKNFDTTEPAGLQAELEAFFAQYGNVNAVRMRRDIHKKFKGSVFCEFQHEEYAKAFLDQVPAPSFNGVKLLIMSKKDYCEMKIREKGLDPSTLKLEEAYTPAEYRGFNAFKQKALAEKKEKGLEDETKKLSGDLYFDYGKTRIKIQPDGTVDEKDAKWEPRSALKYTGAGEGQNLPSWNWAEVKRPLKDHFARLPYVKVAGGDSGFLGFSRTINDDDVELVKSKLPEIAGKEVTWSRPSEEEERKFQLERIAELAKQTIEKSNKPGRGGKAGGRGGGRGAGASGGRGRGGRGGGRGGRSGGSKSQAKGEVKDEAKGEVKGDVKDDIKTDAQEDIKADVKAEAKEDAKTKAKEAVKMETRVDVKMAEAREDVKPEVKVEATGEKRKADEEPSAAGPSKKAKPEES